MGEMNFSLRDLYPNMGCTETSTDAQPDADDKEVLIENASEAAAADPKKARGLHILIGVGVMVAAVIFLGSGE